MRIGKLFSLVTLIFFIVTFGCANEPLIVTEQVSIELPVQSNADVHNFWWYAKFKVHWPENTDPDFSIDTLHLLV